MTIPIWILTGVMLATIGAVGYFVRLVLEHDRRITRLENHQPKDHE